MNEDLRDFLNLKEDGTMNYDISDLRKAGSGWYEISSLGSQYHQANTSKPFLNAKFVNSDGRDVVFNSKKEVVLSYPDKGTFNYADGTLRSSIGSGQHNLYDIIPYNKLMDYNKVVTKNQYYLFGTNSSRWGK